MKSYSVPVIKKILEENAGDALRIHFANGDEFILEPDYEVDHETYDDDGIWLCRIVKAIKGNHPKFHKLFKPEGLVDIFENDIVEIRNEKSGKELFKIA